MESFKDLREFPTIRDDNDEQKFTELLKHIYHRHRHVVPVMAMGVAELKKELQEGVGLLEMPEIHQFLDGFYLSRIGIRILIGQHIALHEPEKENYIGKLASCLEAHRYLADCAQDVVSAKDAAWTITMVCHQIIVDHTCGTHATFHSDSYISLHAFLVVLC